MKSKKFYGTCVRCGEAIETGYPMEFGNAIDPEGGPRHIHCPAVPPRIRKEANRRGFIMKKITAEEVLNYVPLDYVQNNTNTDSKVNTRDGWTSTVRKWIEEHGKVEITLAETARLINSFVHVDTPEGWY